MKYKIKWGDIIFEIFAIFIGIIAAFYVGKYTDNLKEENLKKEYLIAIGEEIDNNLKSAIKFNERLDSRFENFYKLEKGIINRNISFDSLLKFIRPAFLEDSYHPFFHEFETLKASGNLNILKNKKILVQLVKLDSKAKELERFNIKVRDHVHNKLTPALGRYMDFEEFSSEHVKSDKASEAVLDREFRNNILLTINLISSQKYFTKEFIAILQKAKTEI